MGKINVLGFDVANLIAAGEVVDRPASVVKELLENSLDAGASSVTVEIQNGGVSFIRVSDNGCGMDADDLPVAVLRHATSKIKTAEDLDGIRTLGFRGEALAAISSVAKVRIFSKPPEAEFGALLECDGGSVVSLTETGCAAGTTVIVEELFFNVPARRKFLKKDSTETAAVSGVVEKIALSVPGVSVKYIADGEVRFMTAGDGDLHNTIYALYGRQTAARTIAVDRGEGGIRIRGYISEPDNVRSNRNMENFFINGRYVKSRTAAAALEQAFVSRIPAEKFPFCALNIELSPEAVDVNVHPSKLEVKFSNEKVIFDAVYYAVLSALEAPGSRPELSLHASPHAVPAQAPETPGQKNFWAAGEQAQKLFGAFVPQAGARPEKAERAQLRIQVPGTAAAASWQNSASADALPEEPPLPAARPASTAQPDTADMPVSAPAPPEKPEPPQTREAEKEGDAPPPTLSEPKLPSEKPPEDIPDYVIIGEAFNCYIIVQLEDRLVLIDKHAAHERIIFDRLCENMRESRKNAQMLLFPIRVTLTEAELSSLEEYRKQIEAIGFSFRCENDGALITAIPTEISRDAAPDMLTTLAGRLADGTGTVESTQSQYFEARLYQASCKAAIKGGRLYSVENIRWLCDRILCVPRAGGSAIKTCPHGRPVAFEIRKNSIERQFSRLL